MKDNGTLYSENVIPRSIFLELMASTLYGVGDKECEENCMVPKVKHGRDAALMWGCMSGAGV